MLFNIKLEIPIEANSFEDAAFIFQQWLKDEDPLTPVIDVELLNDDGQVIDSKQLDLLEEPWTSLEK